MKFDLHNICNKRQPLPLTIKPFFFYKIPNSKIKDVILPMFINSDSCLVLIIFSIV